MESENSRPYAVVQFPDENDTLSVVPKIWLSATKRKEMYKCRWPKENADKAAKRKISPSEDWPEYRAKLIHSSRSYKNAEKFLEKYRFNSDVDSYASSASNIITVKSPLTTPKEAVITNLPSMEDFNRLEAKIDNLIKANETLKTELEDLQQTVSNLKCTSSNNYEILANIEDFQMLETLEEINLFNEKLKDDEEFKKGVRRCGCLGGKDHKDAVRRVLQALFSHEMALQLTWQKAPLKTSIQNFQNILLFICVSVRTNPSFKATSQTDIEDVIKRWLRYASDRNGGRMERLKKMS